MIETGRGRDDLGTDGIARGGRTTGRKTPDRPQMFGFSAHLSESQSRRQRQARGKNSDDLTGNRVFVPPRNRADGPARPDQGRGIEARRRSSEQASWAPQPAVRNAGRPSWGIGPRRRGSGSSSLPSRPPLETPPPRRRADIRPDQGPHVDRPIRQRRIAGANGPQREPMMRTSSITIGARLAGARPRSWSSGRSSLRAAPASGPSPGPRRCPSRRPPRRSVPPSTVVEHPGRDPLAGQGELVGVLADQGDVGHLAQDPGAQHPELAVPQDRNPGPSYR